MKSKQKNDYSGVICILLTSITLLYFGLTPDVIASTPAAAASEKEEAVQTIAATELDDFDPCGLSDVWCSDEFMATITAYNLVESQCDYTPFIGASGKDLRYAGKTLACPKRYPLGTKFEILGEVWTCEDRLNIKYDNRFDLNFLMDIEAARSFGVQRLSVRIIK
jgi:3D (Asp-Asp-Asp) domain-containing protein